MLRLLGLLLLLSLSPNNSIWAQAPNAPLYIPSTKIGLTVSNDGSGTTVFSRGDLRLTYIDGVGWTPPLEPTLPPPQGERVPVEVVRAASLIAAPEVPLRLSAGPGRLRLVLDLPSPNLWQGPKVELSEYSGRLELRFPFFLPALEGTVAPQGVGLYAQYAQLGTLLSLQAPAGKIYRYRTLQLQSPDRYIVDVYYLEPERREDLGRGFSWVEQWAWTPEPVRMYVLEAAPGSWRMEPVGRPGVRQPLGQMAPQALALINGGYFDLKSGTPIGLWVKDGVSLNFPYGRSTLFWDDNGLFAGRSKFSATVQTKTQTLKVGLNLNKARYTAYTIPGPIGQSGDNFYILKNDRVVAIKPGPYELQAGYWALLFPPSEPVASVGDTLRLNLSLEPPIAYALEAGPLLVQAGQNIFDPNAEPFRDKSPVIANTTQSVVAWTQEGGLWFVISEAMRPESIAKALQERGAWGAIRMDAGSSAQLWLWGKMRVPTEGAARTVVNGLALYPRR